MSVYAQVDKENLTHNGILFSPKKMERNSSIFGNMTNVEAIIPAKSDYFCSLNIVLGFSIKR